MMKNSKLRFSECMQNISRSKSFGKFVLIVMKIVLQEKLQEAILRFVTKFAP
jgi:hypothetical protein